MPEYMEITKIIKRCFPSGFSLSVAEFLGDLFEMSCRFQAATNFHSIKVTQNDQWKKCSS
jgi:hypothetical protein